MGIFDFLFGKKKSTNLDSIDTLKRDLSKLGIIDLTDKNPMPQNGFGSFTFNITGITYEGEWKNGLKHGKGKEIDSSGNIITEGIWEKGVLMTGLKNGDL